MRPPRSVVARESASREAGEAARSDAGRLGVTAMFANGTRRRGSEDAARWAGGHAPPTRRRRLVLGREPAPRFPCDPRLGAGRLVVDPGIPRLLGRRAEALLKGFPRVAGLYDHHCRTAL